MADPDGKGPGEPLTALHQGVEIVGQHGRFLLIYDRGSYWAHELTEGGVKQRLPELTGHSIRKTSLAALVAELSGPRRSAGQTRVGLARRLPAFEKYNSLHPVIDALARGHYPGFDVHDLAPIGSQSLPDRQDLTHVFEELLALGHRLLTAHPSIDRSFLNSLIFTWDPASQLAMKGTCELAFLHTVPFSLCHVPFILHIEYVNTLFYPFIWDGDSFELELKAQPCFWAIRSLLLHPSCLAVFSHVEETCYALPRLFDSPELAEKVLYTPFGTGGGSSAPAPADDSRTHLLFTNSWHQWAPNFYRRGGLDMLLAFLRVAEHHPEAHLTLRTSLPDDLPGPLRARVLSHPQIECLDGWLPAPEMQALLDRTQLFLLPSVALHAVSVVEAMQAGAVCLVSDFWGHDEFLRHGENAWIVPGRQGRNWRRDPDEGFIRHQYSQMQEPDEDFIDRYARAMAELLEQHALRRRLGEQARAYARRYHNLEIWQQGFEHVLGFATHRLFEDALPEAPKLPRPPGRSPAPSTVSAWRQSKT